MERTAQEGAELMSKYGVNVPRGVAVSSVDEIRKAIQDVFPHESEVVVKSQILAGGRGLGTFKNGLKSGVHIVKADQVEDIAGKMLGQILVTKQTGPQGKVFSKLPLYANADYQSAMDEVCRGSVSRIKQLEENFQNQALREGCESLGLKVETVATNSSEDHCCGSCCYGCRTGDKKGTDSTWLVDALNCGAVMLTGIKAEKFMKDEEND